MDAYNGGLTLVGGPYHPQGQAKVAKCTKAEEQGGTLQVEGQQEPCCNRGGNGEPGAKGSQWDWNAAAQGE